MENLTHPRSLKTGAKRSGNSISPRISSVSTTRGPGRLKYWLPSARNTAPSSTARRSFHPSRSVSQCISARVRSRSYPHGEMIMTSGSAAARSSHFIHGECAPASPNRFTAPNIETSSGIQLPAAISGSCHSISATRGRRSVDLHRAAMSAILRSIDSEQRKSSFLDPAGARDAHHVVADIRK